MHIKTATGWKRLQPLYRGAGCYDYPHSQPASNDHGRHLDGFVKFQGVEMTPQTKAFLVNLQRNNAEMKADRIARRGHDRFI